MPSIFYRWRWPLFAGLLLGLALLAWFSWPWAVVLIQPLASCWMGCCCAGALNCGPCCRDRGCQSEFVEYRILSVLDGGDYTCSGTCTTDYSDFQTMTADVTEPQCAWRNLRDCTQASPFPTGYGTTDGVNLRFSQRRWVSCGLPPSIVNTPGQCWLTMLVTGDSTTSGVGGGAWIAIWEKQITGPYPTDCEGTHTLNPVCQSAPAPCDFSTSAVQVNLVFNGACDATATFDPWTDDVDWEIESFCGAIDGDTDTLENVSTPQTQQWEKDHVGVPDVLDVDAFLAWDNVACAYRLTLTNSTPGSCRLVGGSQLRIASPSCEPFEHLFEAFQLENDPDLGPCPCGGSTFDVRIKEPP